MCINKLELLLYTYINKPLFTIIPNSSIKKLMFVFNLFSPPSLNITKTFLPPFINPLMEFISKSVNLFRGSAKTNISAFPKVSCDNISLFL